MNNKLFSGRTMFAKTLLLSAFCIVFLSQCKKESSSDIPEPVVSTVPVASTILVVEGQNETVSLESSFSVKVKVLDQFGMPVNGVVVRFTSPDPNTKLMLRKDFVIIPLPGEGVTDTSGIVDLYWYMPNNSGPQEITATPILDSNASPLNVSGIVIKANAKDLEIGDRYRGGYVFYLDNSGKHGMCASVFPLPSGGGGGTDWGCQGTFISGTGTAIGQGITNTIAINNSCPGPGNRTAAYLASLTPGTQFKDYYLPSLLELKLIYDSKSKLSLSGNSGRQWTSTQVSSNKAYYINMTDGTIGTDDKSKKYMLRPVRTF
ncbi:MAG: hypothetical protein COA58_04300 [Bacteroidetes bacterium]|nr:MAG: hypothetical protein COA58_04300 [Bacteroidota bacterium]